MEEDFDEGDYEADDKDYEASVLPIPSRQLEIRRAIEDRLEARRMREELGYDF